LSLHEGIATEMARFVEDRRDCAVISPSAIAAAVLRIYSADQLEPHIEYASLEHLKNMARKVLAHRFSDEGDANPAYADQGELFSGHLQDRYPLPRKKGEDAVYKLREALTDEEARWNIRTLRRSADARLAHADALEAWNQSRDTPKAA
jgi:hypothetical protein